MTRDLYMTDWDDQRPLELVEQFSCHKMLTTLITFAFLNFKI